MSDAPGSAPEEDTGGSEDDVRRKFREALARKHEQRHASADAATQDGSRKSHGVSGATRSRTFRRKTG